MSSLKNYYRKLKEILKGQATLYFVLLFFFTLYFLRMAICAFFAQSGIRVDWVVFAFLALFALSFVIQSLFLQKKCYPLFLFRVLIVFLLCFQLGYRIHNRAKHISDELSTWESCVMPDNLLGVRLKPNLHDAWLLHTIGNDTIENIYFSTDSFNRRIPDDTFMREYSTSQHQFHKHAVFLGCSFTFGSGLMYSSTFPYLFESINSEYRSYNYGVGGYGPHQMALLFDKRVNRVNKETVPEQKGFALYTYIDDHLNRVYGGSKYLSWGKAAPNVYIENDSLVIKEWPNTQLMYAKFLNTINMFKYFDIGFTYPRKESFYKRFASIINYMAGKYRELCPGNHFYVSIYPGYDKDLQWTQYLDEKIVVLRVAPPSDYENKDKYTLSDGHPSKAANAYYAEELTKVINKDTSNAGFH